MIVVLTVAKVSQTHLKIKENNDYLILKITQYNSINKYENNYKFILIIIILNFYCLICTCSFMFCMQSVCVLRTHLTALYHSLHSVCVRVENTPDGALSWSAFSVCAC